MKIEGLEVVHRAASDTGYAVIAAPHPLYGGSLDNPVVEALAAGFEAAGVSTLCFNYRGVGQSLGEASDNVTRAAEDFAHVLAYARTQLSTHGSSSAPLYAAGYSFGAIAAIACALRDEQAAATPAVSGLVVVAPPLTMLPGADLSRVRAKSFVLIGENDDYLPLDAARPYFGRIERCRVTQNEADHFFAYELEEVSGFAREAAVNV